MRILNLYKFKYSGGLLLMMGILMIACQGGDDRRADAAEIYVPPNVLTVSVDSSPIEWNLWPVDTSVRYVTGNFEPANDTAFTLIDPQYADRTGMYIRKDIIGEIWNYGSMPAIVSEPFVDPYEGKIQSLLPDRMIGSFGKAAGQLDAPRGIAIGPDGSIYVADSRNHRIQRFAEDGTVLNVWGSFADVLSGDAPQGTFNEPWGIAVGQDGSVYVTDTWNHRVQKFTAEGDFITMWGYFGAAENPDGFWGPRGIIVDAENRVYIADTGNKRIAVFDSNGNFLTQFGEVGFELGQLDEPVGLAMGLNGEIYVSDTWNQRIQVFMPDSDKLTYHAINSWDVVGWFGQSLDNKPFLATDNFGNVYTTDPEGFRILGFQPDGQFLIGWGDYSPGSDGFGLPAALAFDSDKGVWVSDAGNSILLHFNLP